MPVDTLPTVPADADRTLKRYGFTRRSPGCVRTFQTSRDGEGIRLTLDLPEVDLDRIHGYRLSTESICWAFPYGDLEEFETFADLIEALETKGL